MVVIGYSCLFIINGWYSWLLMVAVDGYGCEWLWLLMVSNQINNKKEVLLDCH